MCPEPFFEGFFLNNSSLTNISWVPTFQLWLPTSWLEILTPGPKIGSQLPPPHLTEQKIWRSVGLYAQDMMPEGYAWNTTFFFLKTKDYNFPSFLNKRSSHFCKEKATSTGKTLKLSNLSVKQLSFNKKKLIKKIHTREKGRKEGRKEGNKGGKKET